MPRVHFIAIGENVMCNMAIALHKQGSAITVSDHEIAEPYKSNLHQAGIALYTPGWYPENITKELDAVIVGPQVSDNNPEFIKAQELQLNIYSSADYIYKQAIDKQRIVITGSHGKTSIASMVMHILKFHRRKFDYVVDEVPTGFSSTISLTEDAPLIIIEGSKEFTSNMHKTPQFLSYNHHIGLISGIKWDHTNVYPSIEEYVKQFELFADKTPKGGTLIYNENDDLASLICRKERDDVQRIEYSAHKHEISNGQTYINNGYVKIPLNVFGKHNMKNISGAKAICTKIGITEDMFYEALQSYTGLNNRLQVYGQSTTTTIFNDLAHTPSRLKAAVNAVKKQFSSKELTAIVEITNFHKFPQETTKQYKEALKSADTSIIFHTQKSAQAPSISVEEITKAFSNSKLQVFTNSHQLETFLRNTDWKNKNVLFLSAGNFGGINIKQLATDITKKQ